MSSGCHSRDPLIPQVAVIEAVRRDTPDVSTFRVARPEGGLCFDFLPGQCAMLSAPPAGEAMFSITSSPTEKDYMEFSIKRCGVVTEFLHGLEPGAEIGIRGPYGNHFPVRDTLPGKDLLFIAGGIGLAPLRSVIHYVMANRADYGAVDIVYGARSPEDFVHTRDLLEVWPSCPGTAVHLTADRPADGWAGHVGFVPQYVKELGFSRQKTVLLCGPPIMIKLTLQGLLEAGFTKEQIITTLEFKMKCGVGKCGRCNIGDKYVCKDGLCSAATSWRTCRMNTNKRRPDGGTVREAKKMSDKEKVAIYILGKKYEVPPSLTIMDAMEYAGYQLVRGCGCRSGFCGACATIYRIKERQELKVCLACQTTVEDGMYLTQLPFFPGNKKHYDLEQLTASADTMMALYPEIYSCIGCNSCSKGCPQELKVMQYIAFAQRGDLEKCAHESFDCVMCGICASRCPANITHYQVGLLARRLTGKYLAPESEHLTERVREMKEGRYDEAVEALKNKSVDELKELYNARDIEK